MEARRKSGKGEVNYLNPRKSNQFSPSPIKRYHKAPSSSQSTTQTTLKGHTSKQLSKVQSFDEVMIPSFKENEGIVPQNLKQRLIGKREKRALRTLPNEFMGNNREIISHSQIEISQEPKLVQMESNIEVSKDQIKVAILTKQNSSPLLIERSQVPVQIESKPASEKKRDQKQLIKLAEKAEKAQFKQQLSKDTQKPDVAFEEDNSRFEKQSQLNNNLQKTEHMTDCLREEFKSPHQEDPNEDVMADNANNSAMQYQGRWTEEEHQHFLEGLKMFGKDWRSIEDHIGSRTCAQIRSHAQKYFNKLNRDIARSQGKSAAEFKAQMKQKKTLSTKFPPQVQQVQKPNPILPTVKNVQGPLSGIQLVWHTNNQINQIQQALQKLQQDDFVLKMKSLIAERELVSKLYLIDHMISESEAVQRLIPIADSFDQLSKEVLLAKKVDLCNRMINERNLSQLACIMLSSKIAVLPNPDQKRQIIQHVYHSTGSQTEDIQDDSDKAQNPDFPPEQAAYVRE